ncbi:MAG: group II intron reverse transcriptase/maturase [Actinomycetota bacterium]|nr:group II intron reverse transcriptase/maturase [Actinomycetota bacterium]
MDAPKPYEIPKKQVLTAFKLVKASHGAAGIDNQSIEAFEADLKNNLYKIWNRMSSGSYFPPPVKAVEIPKKTGGTRILGVPTVADRVAQMVVKLVLEPVVEPVFHPDSYGYRPGRSAAQALGVTRERCWRYDWVLEFDIRALFDNISHELLMRAVRWHTDNPWVLLYIERWLKAPFQKPDGTIEDRHRGTPQGGVVSPLLANLFMHYTFDAWMARVHPDKPFARYADDAVVHCWTEADAERLKTDLAQRFAECGLELHPTKTRIVYCQDSNRRGTYSNTSFDFLGYTFRPRQSKTGSGKYFVSFSPAVSRKAQTAMRQAIRDWQLHLKTNSSLEDLARIVNPTVRGWMQYYGLFHSSAMFGVLNHLDRELVLWARKKFKKYKRHQRRATHWLGRIARKQPELFAHWALGHRPAEG